MRYWLSFLLGAAFCASAFASVAEVRAVENLRKGTIITKALIYFDTDDNAAQKALAAQYIGKQVRRMIYADHPIGMKDIIPAQVVKRNALVRMQYHYGALKIVTQGRALNAGAIGDVVAVMNLSSRQTVQARIIGYDLVSLSQ